MSTNPKKWSGETGTLEELEEAMNAPQTGSSKSFSQLLLENPDHAGGLAQLAQAEQQAMRRAHNRHQR